MNLIEIACTSTTVAMFLSTLQPTLTFHKSISVPVHPYIFTLVSTALWLRYAILTNARTMILCNALGLMISIYCIFMYIKYSAGDAKLAVEKSVLFYVLLLFKILAVAKFYVNEYTLAWLGPVCSASSIVMLASPLLSLGKVWKFRTTRGYLSFSFTLASLITSVSFLM